MRPAELLQEIRKMRFEEAYEGWNAGRADLATRETSYYNGNALISGSGSADVLIAGAGTDVVWGELGNDHLDLDGGAGQDKLWRDGRDDRLDARPQPHPTAFGFHRLPLCCPATPSSSGSPVIAITPSLYVFRPIDEHNISGYTAHQSKQAAATGGQTIVRRTGLRADSTREMTCPANTAGNDGVWAIAA